ncbi:hypothetical protein, partial [Bifidobacterium apri]|uniref:hypothetical protein n=1 Tax=Bifidobacterium apri TaxID=1769423 RepID=UPI00197AC0FD
MISDQQSSTTQVLHFLRLVLHAPVPSSIDLVGHEFRQSLISTIIARFRDGLCTTVRGKTGA